VLRRGLLAGLATGTLLITNHPAARAGQPPVNAQLVDALVRLERERLSAYVSGDRAVLEQALAPEYVHTNLYGQRTSKRQEIDEFFDSGRFKLGGGDISNATVRRYGPVAILLADVTWTGASYVVPNGTSVDLSGTYSITRVYVLKGRRWLVVSSHASRQRPAALGE